MDEILARGDSMNDVIKAWTDPGPVPAYHYAMQDKLRREWPALAGALDRASEDRHD